MIGLEEALMVFANTRDAEPVRKVFRDLEERALLAEKGRDEASAVISELGFDRARRLLRDADALMVRLCRALGQDSTALSLRVAVVDWANRLPDEVKK